MSASEKVWNLSMNWYSRAHHRLAQDWPRLDSICHMVFYYSFFAVKKLVIYILNIIAYYIPCWNEYIRVLTGRLSCTVTDYVNLATEAHQDIEKINGERKDSLF